MEDSGILGQNVFSNSDEEEEAAIDRRRRSRLSKKVILDSDEEVEADSGFINDSTKIQSDDEISQHSDKENEFRPNIFEHSKPRRIINTLQSESESDDERKNEEVETASTKLNAIQRIKRNDNLESSAVSNVNLVKKLHADSDLFDAEELSEDEDCDREKFVTDLEESSEINLNDIKKSVKNSVAKSGRKQTSGRRKLNKTEVHQLHSDSQRLLREGRVNLPYHVPQKKSLEEFLNRKKWTTDTLKPKADQLDKLLAKLNTEKVSFNQETLPNVVDLKTINQSPNFANQTEKEEKFMSISDDELMADEESSLNIECQKILEDLCDNVSATVINEQQISNIVSTETFDGSEVPQIEEACLNGLNKSRRALLEQRLTNCIPKLSSSSDGVICLDEEEPTLSEVDHFINRFIQHRTATTKAPAPSQQIELNILKKENDNAGDVVLTTEKLVFLSRGDASNNKHVSSIQLLREKLKVEMAKRRAQRRLNLANSNENDTKDGFSEDDEELDEIISDTSDSETEEEAAESDVDDIVFEKKRPKNLFVDDEAEEDGADSEDVESEEEDGCSEDENEEKENKNHDEDKVNQLSKNDLENVESFHLHLESSQPTQSQTFTFKEPSKSQAGDRESNTCLNSSIELIGSLIPGHQPVRRHVDEHLTRTDSQELLDQTLFENTPHIEKTIEESQSIFPSQFDFFSQPVSSCDKFNLNGKDLLSTQDNMDELANLCSGKWTEPLANKNAIGDIDNLCESQVATADNMTELEDLCSGNFNKADADDSDVEDSLIASNDYLIKVDEANMNKLDIDDELSISSLTSDILKRKRFKRFVSDSEDESETLSGKSHDSDSDEEETNPSKNRLSRFVDDEAELSGSDIPSDEDEDVADEDDVLLEELGDMDEFSEDELKNQVEKVHMKLMHDDDQRHLRHVKELYLEDGDLHVDGQQRMRKYRWRNSNENSNDDDLRKEDDSENDADDDAEHKEFRKHRFERESWLSSQQKASQSENSGHEEETLFPNLMKKVQLLNRSNSLLESSKTEVKQVTKCPAKPSVYRGSFLSKTGDKLSRLASLTKSTAAEGSSKPSNSRNFVFASKSPPKPPPNMHSKPNMRRVSTVPSTKLNSLAKRFCAERSNSLSCDSQSSIFHLL